MGALKDDIRIIMGSKGNHFSTLKRSCQDLNRITIGRNLSYSRTVFERSFSQIDMNILSYMVKYVSNFTSESIKFIKIDKKWLFHITGSQKIFWSRI